MITCIALIVGKLYIAADCDTCEKYPAIQLQYTYCIGLYLQNIFKQIFEEPSIQGQLFH